VVGGAPIQGDIRRGANMKPGLRLLLALAGLFLWTSLAWAAELVMFERAGCRWCEMFDREIAPIYEKSPEGRRAPLRRVDITQPMPADLGFLPVDRWTPVFVLVDDGREIGRIRGYPGEAHFWGLFGVLLQQLDESRAAKPD
jgi:hypothetical protein